MSTVLATEDVILGVNPCEDPNARMVAAVSRGGGLGVLDLGRGDRWASQALELAAELVPTGFAVRVPAGCALRPADLERAAPIHTVLLGGGSPWRIGDLTGRYRVLVEVTSRDEALAAATAGASGLVARGHEAGGTVGELSSFVLLQRLLADDTADGAPRLPVWVAGGIGLRTAAASVIGGAAGVVLDSQFALLAESDLPEAVRGGIRGMDGSETILDGGRRTLRRSPVPVGQDGFLASRFATRYGDTASAVRAVRESIRHAAGDPTGADLLAPGAPLAASLGIAVPVAQGPMTRVSDEPGFAAAVADAGGLPFLALALAGAEQTRVDARTHPRRAGRPALGRRRARLRAGGDRGPPSSRSSGRSGPPTRSSPAAGRPRPRRWRRPESPPSCTCRRRACCGSSSRPARAGSSSRAPSAAGTSARAPASRCGRRSSRSSTDFLRCRTARRGASGPLRRAASTTRGRPRWSPRWPRRWPRAGRAGRRAHGHRVPVHRGGRRARRDPAAVPAPGARRRPHRPAGDRARPRHPLRAQPVQRRASADIESGLRGRGRARAGRSGSSWSSSTSGRLRVASKGRRRDGDAAARGRRGTPARRGHVHGRPGRRRCASAITTVAALHAAVSAGAARFHAARAAALRASPAGRRAASPTPRAAGRRDRRAWPACSPARPTSPPSGRTSLGGSGRGHRGAAPTRWDPELYYAPDGAGAQRPRRSGAASCPGSPSTRCGTASRRPRWAASSPCQLLALEAARRALADAGYAERGRSTARAPRWSSAPRRAATCPTRARCAPCCPRYSGSCRRSSTSSCPS